jgi:hypothetical protein
MSVKRGIILSANPQETPEPIMPTCRELVIMIRPSFLKLCGQDTCRAALFNQMLYWIARKAKGQKADKIKSGEVYWYGSYEDICHIGLANSWSMWKVRKEIKALVDAGLIGQRHNPTKGFDREYHYFFGDEQGKVLKALCEKHGINLLELGLRADVLHLLETTDVCAENSRSFDRKQQMPVLKTADSSAENSRAIPKDSPKDSPKETTKKESSASSQDVADATTPSQSSLSVTTASENTDQRQQLAALPTPQASQPAGKPPSSSIEVQPQGKPEMPPDDMPWGPEKMVRVTEHLRLCRNERGAWFSTQPTGKTQKSQWDRQLAAAKKIFAEIPTLTQDEYVAAYRERNDGWWNDNKGSLTVEKMAADTPRKVMRTVELLEEVQSRSERIKCRPAPRMSPVETKTIPQASPLIHDEACQLARDAIAAAKALGHDIQVEAILLENDAWGIVVQWSTQGLEEPETIKSQNRWESALKEMKKVWNVEN